MHEPSALWPAFAGSLTIDLHSLGASYLDEQPAGLREGLQEARVGALPDREDNAGTKKGEAISLVSSYVTSAENTSASRERRCSSAASPSMMSLMSSSPFLSWVSRKTVCARAYQRFAVLRLPSHCCREGGQLLLSWGIRQPPMALALALTVAAARTESCCCCLLAGATYRLPPPPPRLNRLMGSAALWCVALRPQTPPSPATPPRAASGILIRNSVAAKCF